MDPLTPKGSTMNTVTDAGLPPSALQGLRVIEMGQLIAGPFAGKMLGEFGADVIKIEPPGAGDPLRNWRPIKDRTSVWWQVQSAGKVCTAKDIAEDPHYRARNMILRQSTRDGYELEVPGVVPKLLGTPGTVRSSAPGLGDDTDAVLHELGFSIQDIAALRGKKVVG